MRWPIRLQILTPFAGLLVLSLLTLSAVNAYLAVQRSEEQIHQQLRQIARTLQEANFPLTDAVLRQMSGLSGAQYWLVDSNGHVLASSADLPLDESSRGTPVSDWRKLELAQRTRIGDAPFLQMALKLSPNSAASESRILHIAYPEQEFDRAVQQAAFPSLLVGVVTLLLTGATAVLISNRLSRPIRSMSQKVARLTQGEFTPLEVPRRNDEIRDLVQSVNRLAAQLDEMQRAIRRGERLALLGQLSGGIAHNLRNDVTGARMAVQLYQRELGEESECLIVALRQLALAEEHLKRLLTAGQPQQLKRAACDLNELIDDAVSLLAPTARHRHVLLQFERNAQAIFLHADAEQLRHLLLNLLLNALEAVSADAAKGSPWIKVRLEHDETGAVIRVLDSGQGPEPEVAASLFEPFATSKPEGIGLGLTAARQIAQAHGGELVYERVNGATSFVLQLPLNDGRQQDVIEASLQQAVAQ